MKKIVLVALLFLSSSMAHASTSDPISESLSFNFWEWVSALFENSNSEDSQELVKSDGSVYDCLVKSDGSVYD